MKKYGFAVVALCALAGAAMGETATFGSHNYTSLTGATTYGQRAVVYSNVAQTTGLFGTSNADKGAIWGDTLNATGSGTLDEFTFAIFNSTSGGNTGAFKSGTININFYTTGGSFISGFNGTLSYGTDSLAAGFYDFWTFTGLSSLAINLPSSFIVTQNFTASSVIGSNRMGVVGVTAAGAIGTSASTVYLSASPTPAAGFYNLGTHTKDDFLYEVGVIPAPGSLALLGLGGIVAGRRRR